MRLDEWRFSLEVAWDDRWYRWQTIGTLILLFGGMGFMFYKLVPAGLENGLLVFHYNQYFGIDEVLHWWWIFPYAFCFMIAVIFDLIGSFQFFRHDKIASRVLLCTATIFTVLMMIGIHFITAVNV